MNIRESLAPFITETFDAQAAEILAYLPAFPVDPGHIRAVIINETVAAQPALDFYGDAASPYQVSLLSLFHLAGAAVNSLEDITAGGIYLTSVLKCPKTCQTPGSAEVERYVPLLRRELALFPSLQAVMLAGDVARKAFNMLAKSETGKNALPAVSTYKLRHCELFWQGIRLLPAYIMTGDNLKIEKSKSTMCAEELAKLMRLLGGESR
ncbi:uracil-DNA glycosylase family protein [Enterobacillus tribolii]|uniref:Uracil DNA glycosylase superfamily protein n=1 Tax=Enterobacillus tribolii TaxID=1487935 RepID=A0A370QV90_9GAMM|nr:uracil-DNA glycosylase family protein [Enterobacillus tribolii]MBW7981109.1 uracil-DNA glycosylase [Enterobacillus tribolii]RDK92833.1 uracil DNA glycosylase superfamily protein [Enterobacillus tribolii]